MMPLDQWCWEIDRHLDRIEAGADMCLRHVEQLPLRPGFESKAEDVMRRCESTLRQALITVRRARQVYQRKEIGT
jgi:hypothetical protein